MPRLWCLFLLPFLGDTLKSLRKHLRNKMRKMISVSAKIPIKPHAHPETQPGWPISASRAAAETHWEMPWPLQSVLCLRHLCLEPSVSPPALKHQGFPLVTFGLSIFSLWELVVGCSACMPYPWLLKGLGVAHFVWTFPLCDLDSDSRHYFPFY